jgi:hypothetical protein
VLPQEISRGDMRDVTVRRNHLRLSSFSCARRSQENDRDLAAGLLHVNVDSASTGSTRLNFAGQAQLRPIPAASDAAAARAETFIMAHDQLRLDLRNRIHGHAHNDQQRGASKVEGHA